MSVWRSWLAAGAAFLTLAVSAAADPASDWTITVGVDGRVLPSYEGSARSMLAPFPLFDVRRAGTPRNFSSPRDGFSFGILDSPRFQVGPAVKLRFPRKEGNDSDLRGLGDIGWTLEAGAFAEYCRPTGCAGVSSCARASAAIMVFSDLTADLVMPVTPQLTLSGGPRLTLASAAATSPYFGITPTQSVGSGLPVYAASGGLRSLGAGAQARYEWSKTWATHLFVEYERLAGDAANSPIVAAHGSRDQIQVGLGVTTSFDIRGLW